MPTKTPRLLREGFSAELPPPQVLPENLHGSIHWDELLAKSGSSSGWLFVMFDLAQCGVCQELSFWLLVVYYRSQSSALNGKCRQRCLEPPTCQPRLPLLPRLFGLEKPLSFPRVWVPTARHSSPWSHSNHSLLSLIMMHPHFLRHESRAVCLLGLCYTTLPVRWSPPCPLSQQASCFIPGSAAATDCGAPHRQWASLGTGDRVSNA